MAAVKQLIEEFKEVVNRKKRLEREMNSLDFCLNVMKKEINERLPPARLHTI